MSSFAFGVAPQALARFNAVMSSKLEFRVESTNAVVAAVNAKRKPGTRTAVLFAALSGSKSIPVRPIDLLRKLGTLTTPASGNMAKLSASWATLRYCWAIEPNAGSKAIPFRLSGDARRLDFHQKTLLSDECRSSGQVAQIGYSYSVAGNFYAGRYKRVRDRRRGLGLPTRPQRQTSVCLVQPGQTIDVGLVG